MALLRPVLAISLVQIQGEEGGGKAAAGEDHRFWIDPLSQPPCPHFLPLPTTSGQFHSFPASFCPLPSPCLHHWLTHSSLTRSSFPTGALVVRTAGAHFTAAAQQPNACGFSLHIYR